MYKMKYSILCKSVSLQMSLFIVHWNDFISKDETGEKPTSTTFRRPAWFFQKVEGCEGCFIYIYVKKEVYFCLENPHALAEQHETLQPCIYLLLCPQWNSALPFNEHTEQLLRHSLATPQHFDTTVIRAGFVAGARIHWSDTAEILKGDGCTKHLLTACLFDIQINISHIGSVFHC